MKTAHHVASNSPHAESPAISRRRALGVGALLAGSILTHSRAANEAPASPRAKRVLRFAHPTDIHVQPERRGGEGMASCFRHMMALDNLPELIITGGDLPMDTASTPADRSRVEWDLFKSVLADCVPSQMPIYHTLGNHDVFGRDKVACKSSGDESFYGKKWFLQNFNYERTYRSFDMAGWHFVILDSIDLLPDGDEFEARIRGEQLEWFVNDLKSTPPATPIVVVSHVPIISVTNYFDKDEDEWRTDGPDMNVPKKRMHADCRELDALFQKHRNVRLCLSGHIHLLDHCEYNGVTYICDGAVSGAKWKGPKRETPEGYGLIDLFDDGSFEHRYQTFGWQAK